MYTIVKFVCLESSSFFLCSQCFSLLWKSFSKASLTIQTNNKHSSRTYRRAQIISSCLSGLIINLFYGNRFCFIKGALTVRLVLHDELGRPNDLHTIDLMGTFSRPLTLIRLIAVELNEQRKVWFHTFDWSMTKLKDVKMIHLAGIIHPSKSST